MYVIGECQYSNVNLQTSKFVHRRYIRKLVDRMSGRSFRWRRKSNGPRTVPCGTPMVIMVYDDVAPLTTTCWVRPIRNISIHVAQKYRNNLVYE